jgi:3-hydroxyisobutyrate dehydrogenase
MGRVMINKQQEIGLIGAGLMGSGIALSLLRGDHRLTILEHPGNQPLDALIKAGAQTCTSASDLASRSDVLILCVTGTPQVEQVLLQEDGVLQGMKKGCTIIDCSTAIPSSTLKIAKLIEDKGGKFLDAPMTRTPKEAAEGRLNLIVGGDADVYQACLPILQSYAENITYAGPTGAGHKMKLLHNYVSLGFSVLLAEAAACAHKAGIDEKAFCEILANGGGGGVVLNRLRPFIESGDTSGFQFSISNALKDMTYYCALAEDQHARSDIAQSVKTAYSAAAQAGLEQEPLPKIVDFFSSKFD